ncbi:helix-turn-helix transcriptional regulator [Malikia spinosa]|jgi:transcriptional regulator with XRE-family HTH domain|uniref:Helix-turn-helix transcriptional regulator n=2 Tax=Malikia spinosa TaxID=86180 RepID=A0A7C9MTQ6_9BURK|nr:helix-turn-helix transcriptional regulator [Malikia spinosa]MYZ51217.1 helix-turn-helix transcriptional regulator [Malikia spinosa]
MKPESRPTTPSPSPSARELLARNLVRLRAERRYSQEDLAHEAGLHRTFVAHVERRVRNISLDNLEKLAVALGVPVASLLEPS